MDGKFGRGGSRWALLLIGVNACSSSDNDVAEPVDSSRASLVGRTDVVTFTTLNQLEPRRQALRTKIWGTAGLPTTQATVHALTANCTQPAFSGVALKQELRFPMGAIEGLACHLVPTSANGRLVVYNPGHANTVGDGSNWSSDVNGGYGDQRAIQALLTDGYSVLLTFMPQFRPDDPPNGVNHQAMFTNPAMQPAIGSVWQYFFGAVLGGLNYVQNNAAAGGFPQYTEYDMLGLSGGGWTTVVYAAVDTRIKTSIHVAGSEPLEFWGQDLQEEQTLAPLYDIAAYRDLYILGAAGGRRQVQVLNRRDSCCFFPGWLPGPGSVPAANWQSSVRLYETQVRSALVNLGDAGTFRTEIDEAAVQHQISRNAMANVVLAELEGNRSHVAAASASSALARGANGNMWEWTSAGWSDTGLPMVGTPAVVANVAPHLLDVFYRDSGNNLRQAWKVGANWTSQALSGVVVSDPAAVSWGPGRIDIVAFGGDYNLYHWATGQAGADAPAPGVFGLGTPTIVSAGVNSLDIVFRNLDHGVTRVFWNGAAWSSENLGGTIRGFPTAAITAGPTRRVYSIGTGQGLFEKARPNAGAWSAWQSVSVAAGVGATKLAGSPRAVIRSSDSVVLVQTRLFVGDSLGIFARPNTWSFSGAGASAFRGSPTPLPTGGAWVASPVSHLRLWDGVAWSDKGGIIE